MFELTYLAIYANFVYTYCVCQYS